MRGGARAPHTHLRGGGWPLWRRNALSSLSWLILEFPPGRENLKGVLSTSGLLSVGRLSSESSLDLALSGGGSPLLGRWEGLLAGVLCLSVLWSLSRPRGLLEVEPLPKARTSCGAGLAVGQVEGSGTFPVSSSWAWVTLPVAGDRLRERLRKES